MSISIPETMQAVRLEEENGTLQVRQIPVPMPGPGEVLVRMAASTINPSDIGFMYSTSGYSNRTLPVTPGIEGSGTVVAAGQGILTNFMTSQNRWMIYQCYQLHQSFHHLTSALQDNLLHASK